MSPRTGRTGGVKLIACAVIAGLTLLAAAACTSNSSAPDSSAAGASGTNSVATQTAAADGTDPSVPSASATADPNTTPATEPSAPAPATTLVPPTNAGDTAVTVPPGTMTTNPPVSVNAVSDLGNGVTVSITDARAVDAVAVGPGEVGGSAMAITVVINNSSAEMVDLGGLTVAAQDAAGLPGLPASGAPANPILGAVDAGQQVTGVYVFVLPPNHTNPMTYSVSSTPEVPVALFVGDTQ